MVLRAVCRFSEASIAVLIRLIVGRPLIDLTDRQIELKID